MKKYLGSIVSLTVICLAVSVLLAAANGITAPVIEKAEGEKANAALLAVMPEGKDFQEIDVSAYTLPTSVTGAYSEAGGGHVLRLATTGYAAGLTIMCGVDKNGKITGAACISSGETLGYEKTYGERFAGLAAEEAALVATVAGATKTTTAYKKAVADAINAATILSGGSADIRTEEEILRDNLAAALPAGESFAKEFMAEELQGVSAVYKAENGAGYVFVLGESFIGIDAGGNVVSEADKETQAAAKAAFTSHTSTVLSEIELSAYAGISPRVEKAYRTASGNYVFELSAAGYGINGEYGASGKYIRIKVSATAGGKIIDCVTLEQHETENVGSACADPKYYEQYRGKTAETLGEVDTIAGATYTHRGYSVAVSKVFEAIEILKGAKR
ncbi:MAG: FMN-binding protein [Clostridia bacterium]|nr:FMN-binding protein [Clostridia bacterium]